MVFLMGILREDRSVEKARTTPSEVPATREFLRLSDGSAMEIILRYLNEVDRAKSAQRACALATTIIAEQTHYSRPAIFLYNPRTDSLELAAYANHNPTAERKGGIHAGQLKSYIQLCLALSQMAKTAKSASPKPQQHENPKYAMRTWLLRLGFIGDEFTTARDILTRRLSGDAAYRSGRNAACRR